MDNSEVHQHIHIKISQFILHIKKEKLFQISCKAYSVLCLGGEHSDTDIVVLHVNYSLLLNRIQSH